MKTFRASILLAVAFGCVFNASATLYTSSFSSGFANGGVVLDGNTTGWSDTRTLSGIDAPIITDVNVSINLTGGYNGDLYAYLVHDSGFSVLLNRVGRTSGNSFGYGNSGFNITFDDSAANGDIHTYQTVPGFSTLITDGSAWSPDGRNVNPLLTLNTGSRTSMLAQFNGLNPNGNWTLFIADVSTGDQTTVAGWSLSITAVPEASSLWSGFCLVTLSAAAMLRRKFC
jgi:subtilisin-like proprotein convertase family protein